MKSRGWLQDRHPIYNAWADEWRREEDRYRAGREVLAELRHFDWEDRNGDHFRMRAQQATYLPFPAMHAEVMAGHLFRRAPDAGSGLDFGTLGEVDSGRGELSRADLVYYNTDGGGRVGTSWLAWWMEVTRWTQVTGHRWVMVEAPGQRPRNQQDELNGLHPYLVHLSPLEVTNWEYSEGVLQFAVIQSMQRRPRLEEGRWKDSRALPVYYLLVAGGYQDLGVEYAPGGWWLYDHEGQPLQRSRGAVEGRWESTQGEVPLFPYFYQRDRQPMVDTTGIHVTEGERVLQARAFTPPVRPSFSRPGVTGLGQVAVSYMNQSSAADFDAWDAAQSNLLVLGATTDSFNTAVQKWKEGNRFIPFPPAADGAIPEVQDGSTGAVSAEVFRARLEHKLAEARYLSAIEATSDPGSSGESKRVGFMDAKAPRLAAMAQEAEAAQGNALRLLELRWSGGQVIQPTSQVRWVKDFDLRDLLEDIDGMFQLMELAGLKSPTLSASMLVASARQRGLLSEEANEQTVREEFRAAAEKGAAASDARRSFLAEMGGAPGTSPEAEEDAEGPDA